MNSHLYEEMYELENKHWWFKARKKIVLSLLDQYLAGNNNSILDVGCGCGTILNDLQRYGMASGMDCAEEAIKFSKLNYNGEIKKGSMPDDIPFPNDHFDAILMLDVLEHVEQDVRCLESASMHLKAKGIFIITVPAYRFLWSAHDDVHGHKRRYKIGEIKEKLLAIDLEVLKTSYFNTFLFVPIFATRIIHQIMRTKEGSDAKMLQRHLNLLFEAIFSSEAGILRIADMPFGVSIIAVARKH